jgi:hypothetical protein
MDSTEEKVTNLGEIDLGNDSALRVTLRQKLTQEVCFSYQHCGFEPSKSIVPPLALKQVRHLQRLLAKAQRKMQKAIKRLGK